MKACVTHRMTFREHLEGLRKMREKMWGHMRQMAEDRSQRRKWTEARVRR